MSDREDNDHIIQHSREGSVLSQQSITEKKVIYRRTSDHGSDRGRSRSRSRSPVAVDDHKSRSRREYSGSRSRSRSRSRRSRRNSSRYRSRSRSSRRYKSRYSYSRSRSGSGEGDGFHSHSRSPMSTRRRHLGNRVTGYQGDDHYQDNRQSKDNPPPGRCLGVFGLNIYTTENQLLGIFSKYGPVDKVQVVIDAKSGRSRGFCFVYFESADDAKVAKEQCSGMEIDGRRIRVDYSLTTRAHTPTPGIYMGKPTYMEERWQRASGNRDYNEDYHGGGRGGGYRNSYRSSYRRSPSPYSRRGSRYVRSRSRSYSPRRY